MLEALEFIFRSFWTWLGTVILVFIVCIAVPAYIAVLSQAARRK